MNNFSFEPLKLKLATNNIIIPLENGVADLTNAETSAKIMLAGKELFPTFDERIGGRNYIPSFTNVEAWGEFSDRFEVHPNKIINHKTGGLSKYIIINLEPNSKYVLRLESNARSYLTTYDNEDNIIAKTNRTGNRLEYIDTSTGITYIRLRLNPSSASWGTKYYYANLTLVKGSTPTDWTPAPEELLSNAVIIAYNCSAAIVGDLVKITSHKPGTTRGWVDVTVNYENLSNTKRLNWSVEGVEPYKPSGTLLTMNNRGVKL